MSFLIGYYRYSYNSGINYAIFTFVSLPVAGILSVRLSDIALDVLKSTRPLVVSLGNVLSSSEPLREMRSDLQKRIREIVDELGTSVFPDFDEIRELNKPKTPPSSMSSPSMNFNRSAADKLGRSKDIETIRAYENDNFENVDLFSSIAYKEQFGDAFDKVEF